MGFVNIAIVLNYYDNSINYVRGSRVRPDFVYIYTTIMIFISDMLQIQECFIII